MSDLLRALAPETDRCNRCGFCQAGCPTYKVTGSEWLLMRGRVALAEAAAEGKVPLAEIAHAMDTCLLCEACVSHCPSGIDIARIVTTARAAIKAETGLAPWQRLLYRRLLPRPWLLNLGARLGYAAERVGLRRWLAARAQPGLLKRALALGPAAPPMRARKLIARTAGAGTAAGKHSARPARVAYFVTCSKEYLYPDSAAAAVRVLRRCGAEVVVPDTFCCGLLCQNGGDPAAAQALARANVERLQAFDVDFICGDDASCVAHMTDWVQVLAGTPDEAAARAVAARLREFAALVDELGLPAGARLEATVTWHDPCSLRHGLKQVAPPRRLLQGIPGVTFVEAEQLDMCCGGAGTFAVTQAELSDQLLDVKVQAYGATGAEYVITSSASCIMQLRRGMADRRVLYLSEFLDLACSSGGD